MVDKTLKELQIQVDKWCNTFTPAYFPPLSIMAQIQEESGELAKEINDRYGGRVKKSGEDTKDIGAELCDLFFALFFMANSHNINLSEAWDKTIGPRFERDKDRYNKIPDN
jgi:NTP pyrophosphatase (non-canonical NTP hydrolase)